MGGFKTINVGTPVGRPITTIPGLPTSSNPTPQPQPSTQPTNNNNNNPYIKPETPQSTPTQPQAPEYTATANPYANTTNTASSGGGSGSYIPPTIYGTDQTNTNTATNP